MLPKSMADEQIHEKDVIFPLELKVWCFFCDYATSIPLKTPNVLDPGLCRTPFEDVIV
jgi:hypothetical protein